MKKKKNLYLIMYLLCAVFGSLTGCTTGVNSGAIPADHPANPQGPEGTAAPVSPLKTDAQEPAGSDESAQTEHHHHGM